MELKEMKQVENQRARAIPSKTGMRRGKSNCITCLRDGVEASRVIAKVQLSWYIYENSSVFRLERAAPPHSGAIHGRRLSKPSESPPMPLAGLNPHRREATRSGRALGQGP